LINGLNKIKNTVRFILEYYIRILKSKNIGRKEWNE
jgi:hypothetical protein